MIPLVSSKLFGSMAVTIMGGAYVCHRLDVGVYSDPLCDILPYSGHEKPAGVIECFSIQEFI